jgi:hypothetical protein
METTDSELTILEGIYSAEKKKHDLRQRDLAHISGLSLGMTNAILKRFTRKGWIIVMHINKRNLKYGITPEGMNEIAQRTFRYFKRTIRNVAFYRDMLDDLLNAMSKDGFSGILLLGISDLDFLIEYLAEKNGLLFIKSFEIENAEKLILTGKFLYMFSESIDKPAISEAHEIYLSDILSRPANERVNLLPPL